jgi:8-oxo-dGTP pyrophosphatase MutT (NUDIX family)
MSSLQQYKARRCATAAGILVVENKALLLLHKKVHIWLAPGGHLDEHELPHEAAQREFFEETNITVSAYSPNPPLTSHTNEYLPNPIAIDLHWISKENYHHRIKSTHPDEPCISTLWPRGCEQHYTFIYLMKPIGKTIPVLNKKESLDIRWFTRSELETEEILPSIRNECLLAINISNQSN